jgi:hypothetical protein
MDKIGQTFIVISAINDFIHQEAHFIFAWRYWQVSEILSRRINQTQILSDCVLKGLLVTVTLCLLTNEIFEVIIRLDNEQSKSLVTQGYFPLALFLLEAVLIAGSVIRVWLILR